MKNQASPAEVAELEQLLEVTITKPMRSSTCHKLKRLAGSTPDDECSGFEEHCMRDDLWSQVARYTDQTSTELLFGKPSG